MKKVITALTVLFILLQASFIAYAEDGFSGQTGVRSNYMWRGYDQNRFTPMVEFQAQYDYKGAYAGVWVGEVDSLTHDGSEEYNFYGGYNFKPYGDWAFGVGAIHYEWSGNVLDNVTEGFATAIYRNIIEFEFYFDLDDSLDVKRFYNIKVPVSQIPYADVTFEYGKWEDGYDFVTIGVFKSFGDWNVGFKFMPEVNEGNIIAAVNYSF